jgi:hypothetical protein
MRAATVHPAKSAGNSFTKPAIASHATLAVALNNRRFCSSDSWLQKGNICLKTCTAFTAGFMPEMVISCVKILASGAPMAASRAGLVGIEQKNI